MMVFKVLVLVAVGFICTSGIFVAINSLRKGERDERRTSVVMLVILVPLLFITTKWTFKKVATPNKPVVKVAEKKVEAPKKELTKEEKDAIEYNNKVQAFMAWKDAQFSVWDGSCTPLIKLVKDNMNNPKSFKHYKTQFRVDMLKGVEVEMEYGGTNAFGGMVRNTVRGYIDYNTKTIKITHINGEKVN